MKLTLATLTFLTSTTLFAATPFTAPPSTTNPTPNPTLIDPAASRALDAEDLTNKLTGAQNLGDSAPQSPSDKLHEIASRMDQTTARLTDKDPGLTTQELQSRIIASLDSLIHQLQNQDNPNPNPNPSSTNQPQPPQPSHAERTTTPGGPAPATTDAPKPGSPATPIPAQELREVRQSIMNLRDADRGPILNGLTHDVLPEYKVQVRRYYEALAELGKSHQNP